MTTISVPDMMCENCVKRITNALTAAELKFSVSLRQLRQDSRQRAGGSGLHAGGPLNPLKTEGVPQQVPRLNRQARGLFFCVGFMSPICYFFYFFSRLLHSSTALFFCKVGDITP